MISLMRAQNPYEVILDNSDAELSNDSSAILFVSNHTNGQDFPSVAELCSLRTNNLSHLESTELFAVVYQRHTLVTVRIENQSKFSVASRKIPAYTGSRKSGEIPA
jgi:hypothetical protein